MKVIAYDSFILFAALWWVWNYTAWVTNWLEPERRPVHAALLLLTLAALALSMALPEAFGARGAAFACALVAMQLGRALFMLWAVRADRDRSRDFLRVGAWTAGSGAL